jgi:flagellar secretion chaperone FliS
MREGELYLKNNLEGMNNDELILFVYQETLKILNQILFYFEKNDVEKRVNAINKCIEILNTLISILNFDQGGEIAVRLRSLYLYSIKKLTVANYDKDPQPVDEVIRIFKELYGGWTQKMESDKKNAASASPNGFNSPLGGQQYGGGEKKGLEIYG